MVDESAASDITIDAIMAGVEASIDDVGFDDVTLSDIVERSGVSRATIYRRVGDRPTILRTYIAHVCMPHILEGVNIARSPGPLRQRMEDVLVHGATSWRDKSCLLRQLRLGNMGWLEILETILKTMREDLAVPVLFREAEAMGWTMPVPEEELHHWLIEQSCALARNHLDDIDEIRRQIRIYIMPVLHLP